MMNWLRNLLNAPVEVPCKREFPDITDPTLLFRARREAVLAAIDAAILERTGIPGEFIRDVPPERLHALIALGVKLKG